MNGLTLASVEEAFQQWRAERHSSAERIPDALWLMALGLYPQHKRSKICTLLHLSGTQFKQRLETGGHTSVNSGFVVASREILKATPASSSKVQLTLQGQARSMTLCFDIHELGQVLPHVSVLL